MAFDRDGSRQRARLGRRAFLGLTGAGAAALVAACGGAPAASPTTAPKAAATAPAAGATKPAAGATTAATTAATPGAAATKPAGATTPSATPATAATKPAAAGTTAPAASAKPAATAEILAQLPADAAPANEQVRLFEGPPGGKAMDFYETVYNRAPGADMFSLPLVHITKDFEVVSGAAEKWENSADGKSWTFTLRKGIMWSDGSELTAEDYIETFRYSADPKHAWDFTWYWQGVIRNYDEAVKGTVAPTEIGVKQGADRYQLVFDTVNPVPYLPSQLLYSMPLHAASLKKTGSGAYNTNPQTSVSCGPYVLKEWSPDRRVVLEANPKFTGQIKPHIQRLVYNIIPAGTTATGFTRFQANEVDQANPANPAEIKLITSDPKLQELFKVRAEDFRTFYLFFDVNTAPWDKLEVRQAFSMAVDREGIVKALLAPLGLPAYSFLMPGFPDANQEGLKSIQAYNPDMAKQKLASAGYPNGQGFPQVTLFVRGGGPGTDAALTQALASGFKQVLGVDVQLQTQDSPTYMQNLNAKPTKVPFGWISYGMDYLDATNMLGVFKSGGRHSWKNDQFDKLLAEGGQMSGNPQRRSQIMQEAEKILVSDVPAIFVYHQLTGTLYKPYLKGPILEQNRFGYTGEQWPGFNVMTLAIPNLYISKEVTNFRGPQ